MATRQEQLIQAVEDVIALTSDVDECHRLMALRGHQLSRENIEELMRATTANRKSHGLLLLVRQLVAKRGSNYDDTK